MDDEKGGPFFFFFGFFFLFLFSCGQRGGTNPWVKNTLEIKADVGVRRIELKNDKKANVLCICLLIFIFFRHSHRIVIPF